jgi:hypothetical protein
MCDVVHWQKSPNRRHTPVFMATDQIQPEFVPRSSSPSLVHVNTENRADTRWLGSPVWRRDWHHSTFSLVNAQENPGQKKNSLDWIAVLFSFLFLCLRLTELFLDTPKSENIFFSLIVSLSRRTCILQDSSVGTYLIPKQRRVPSIASSASSPCSYWSSLANHTHCSRLCGSVYPLPTRFPRVSSYFGGRSRCFGPTHLSESPTSPPTISATLCSLCGPWNVCPLKVSPHCGHRRSPPPSYTCSRIDGPQTHNRSSVVPSNLAAWQRPTFTYYARVKYPHFHRVELGEETRYLLFPTTLCVIEI